MLFLPERVDSLTFCTMHHHLFQYHNNTSGYRNLLSAHLHQPRLDTLDCHIYPNADIGLDAILYPPGYWPWMLLLRTSG